MKQLSIALASLFAVCGVVNDAHALEKSMSRTRGNQASFSSATDTDCGYSSIYVWAFEEAGRNTDPYSSNVLYVDYWAYDYSTGESTYASGSFDRTAFNANRLKSATADVSATVDVQTCHVVEGGGGSGGGDGGMGWYEYVCESSTQPLLIDLTWKASGTIYKDRSNYSYSTPYSRYRSTYTGQSVDATVSGLVSIGDIDFDPAGGYGSLGYTASGSFEMYH